MRTVCKRVALSFRAVSGVREGSRLMSSQRFDESRDLPAALPEGAAPGAALSAHGEATAIRPISLTTLRCTVRTVAAIRSTIVESSASGVTKAGASRV